LASLWVKYVIPMVGRGRQRLACDSDQGVLFHYVPHPSGRNPWYNQLENCARVGARLAQIYNAYLDFVREGRDGD